MAAPTDGALVFAEYVQVPLALWQEATAFSERVCGGGGNTMLKRIEQFTVVLLTVVVLGACSQAKTPSDVTKDVNSASEKAAKNTADAQEKAADKVAVQEENVAKTDAEGRRQIALAKCEALSGDRQQACKDEAKASYDMAIAKAKEERAATDAKQ